MSASREDRYYGTSMGKSRRTPPTGDPQNSVFFQPGQGGRPVLPPLSSAVPNSHFAAPASYSNQYAQPRSSPSRYDYNPALYNQWADNPASSPQPSYPYYDAQDHRYNASQQSYTTYPTSRSPALPDTTSDPSRKLPPLATSHTSQAYGRDERWQTATYVPSGMPGNPHIRSPTASYPTPYTNFGPQNPTSNYTYMPAQSHHSSMTSQGHSSLAGAIPGRSTSPYGHGSSHGTSYSPPPPLSPTTSEEPTIKKKRKRADAAQLKILTETYNRTAFPSTEERMQLAKALDMTPRSVQIWFQNRRQSMRQTRQSSSASGGAQQGYGMASDPMDEPSGSGNYDLVSSSGYRGRSQEASDSRKPQQWPRAY